MNDKTLEGLRYYFNGYGSRHDETILKLIEQNKRYRKAFVEMKSVTNEYGLSCGIMIQEIEWMIDKALEESE